MVPGGEEEGNGRKTELGEEAEEDTTRQEDEEEEVEEERDDATVSREDEEEEEEVERQVPERETGREGRDVQNAGEVEHRDTRLVAEPSEVRVVGMAEGRAEKVMHELKKEGEVGNWRANLRLEDEPCFPKFGEEMIGTGVVGSPRANRFISLCNPPNSLNSCWISL